MEQQRLLNLLSRVGAFVSTQSCLGGVKLVVGGIALAMASTDQMIKPARYGG
jgi:hypothetical protein